MQDRTGNSVGRADLDDVFTEAAKNQYRALFSTVMAEYSSRVSKRSLGVIEELFSLGIMTGGMLLLRVLAGAPTHHGMPIIPFVVSGLVLFWMLRTTMFRVATFKSAKAAFKNNPRVTALDVLASRAILNTAFYVVLAYPIFGLMYLFGVSPPVHDPWAMFLLMLLMGVWAFSLGLCFGALFLYVPFARTVVQGMMMAVMWTSGILFIWPEAPYMFRGALYYNPVFHFMELMRTVYFSSYITAMGSWYYIGIVVSVTLAFGLMLERVVRRRAESTVQRVAATEESFDGEGL
ncbi:ABC transporter permease [Xanthobacter agilis]|uniref:ABC transporter permease n=1 Tax=Xanthobacter agilis TaxID=47492 RepID=UPI001F001CE1